MYWRQLWRVGELVMDVADMAFALSDRVTKGRYVRDTAIILAAIDDVLSRLLSGIRPVQYRLHSFRLIRTKKYVPRLVDGPDTHLPHR